jgi:hypothetical protein
MGQMVMTKEELISGKTCRAAGIGEYDNKGVSNK